MRKLLSVITSLIVFGAYSPARAIVAHGNSTQTPRPEASGRAAREMVVAAETTRVMVTGDALVQAQPDTAIVTIGVVTQSQSALKAQQENATKTETVLRVVKGAAGTGAEVKTSGYSLQPQYTYRENQPPIIKGYEARNAVTVTMSDLAKVGPVIDAASQAGANNVDNLSFTLRQDRPARDQALTEATREALSKAQTMAQALGGRVVRIVKVQEASALRPPIVYKNDEAVRFRATAAQAATPIEIGSLDIRSQVQLVAEIETKQ